MAPRLLLPCLLALALPYSVLAQAPCYAPPGSYCSNSTANASAPLLCPAGRFGYESGLTSATCSGACDVSCSCAAGTVLPWAPNHVGVCNASTNCTAPPPSAATNGSGCKATTTTCSAATSCNGCLAKEYADNRLALNLCSACAPSYYSPLYELSYYFPNEPTPCYSCGENLRAAVVLAVATVTLPFWLLLFLPKLCFRDWVLFALHSASSGSNRQSFITASFWRLVSGLVLLGNSGVQYPPPIQYPF